MFHKVRKNFIAITMTMLTLVLTVPLCALNVVTAILTYNNTNELLEQIAQTEVYILEPDKRKPADIPPVPNENMGAGKQIHTTTITTTTAATTTTTTVPPSSEEETEGRKTTAHITYQPPTVGTTAPTEPQPPTNGTTVTTVTPPPPPGWGDWTEPTGQTNQTRPTRPTRPQYTGTTWYDNGWGNDDDNKWADVNNGYFHGDNEWNGEYAVDVFAAGLSPAAIIQAVSSRGIIASAAATEAVTTAVTTMTYPPEPPSEPFAETSRGLVTKVFDKEIKLPDEHEMAAPSSIDHFVVYLDKTEQVTNIHGTDSYTAETCAGIIAGLEKGEKYEGRYGNLQYVRKDYRDGAVMVFSDRSSDMKMMKTLLFVSVGMFILMECMVFVLTKILTKRAMKPMQISIEKQQQFISDAGHELKTPLTVISANADILADEIGDNKWLTYIKGQAERMRILVQEMLDLTKITNSDQHIAQSRFNISSLVENVALPFECQAFEQKKEFHIELEPDVEFFGNTERIRRMVGIFIDNAFKYSNENGTIQVQLKTDSGKKVLKIYNTGIGIEKGEEEKIFERFYRSDSSRSKQGGYGLGLAIAKSIADQHGIKIQVVTEPGQWVSFNLTL